MNELYTKSMRARILLRMPERSPARLEHIYGKPFKCFPFHYIIIIGRSARKFIY